MGRPRLLFLLLALVAALAAGLLLGDEPLAVTDAADRGDGSLERANAATGSHVQGTRELPTTGPVRDTIQPPAAAGTTLRTVLVVGRCVQPDSDTPVAGVRLTLAVHLGELQDYEVPLNRARRFQAPPGTVSAADGRFAFRFPMPAEDLPVVLRAEPPHMVLAGVQIAAEEAEPDASELRVELEDVEVRPGFPVRGRVVNQHGQPIQTDVLVVANDEGFALVEDGRFDCGQLPAGEFDLWLQSAGTVVEPRVLRVGPGVDTTAVRILVNEPPAVTGVVLDTGTGAPVPGYFLEAELRAGGHIAGRTDDQGRFRLHADSLTDRFVRFLPATFDPHAPQPRLAPTDWMPLPGTGVVLRVQPWPEFRIRVRHADGRPARDARVQHKNGLQLHRVTESPTGESSWIGLPPERAWIRVTVGRPATAVSRWQEIDPAHWRQRPLDVELTDTVPLAVHVTRPATLKGRPSVIVRSALGPLATGPVDATGLARLRVPARFAGCSLIVVLHPARSSTVLDAGHERSRRVDVQLVDPRPTDRARLQVELDPGLSAVRNLVRRRLLGLRRADTTKARSLPAHGTIELDPGDWEVITHPQATYWRPAQGQVRHGRRSEVLARVRLAPGERRRLTVTPPGLAAGAVTGSVRHGGALLGDVSVRFSSTDGLWHLHTSVDGGGQLERLALPAGRYHASVVDFPVPGVTRERVLWFQGTVEVRAGVTSEVHLTTGTATRTLRILQPDGTPARHTWLEIEPYGQARTDGDGEVRIHPLPPGRLAIETIPAAGPSRHAVVRPDAAGSSGAQVVRLR